MAALTSFAAAAPETRQPWQNMRLMGSPEKPAELVAVAAYARLPVKRPVVIEWEPGTNRLLVLENFARDVNRTTLKRFEDRPEVNGTRSCRP